MAKKENKNEKEISKESIILEEYQKILREKQKLEEEVKQLKKATKLKEVLNNLDKTPVLIFKPSETFKRLTKLEDPNYVEVAASKLVSQKLDELNFWDKLIGGLVKKWAPMIMILGIALIILGTGVYTLYKTWVNAHPNIITKEKVIVITSEEDFNKYVKNNLVVNSSANIEIKNNNQNKYIPVSQVIQNGQK
jgi:hypothetical protein